MQFSLVAALAAVAAAAPVVERQAQVNDGLILNYALTLEHLEATFYRETLKKFSKADFKKAGLPASFYNNLKEIALDEKTHVDFLTTALGQAGVTAVAECKYNFGLDSVNTFLAIANVLEGVGVSAYLGAAQYITTPGYLTAAGSILTVEARHSAYLRQNQQPAKSPFPAPFDTPLTFNEVFSLAAPFIVSCPPGPTSSLEVLSGFKAFPAITVAPAGVAKIGDKLQLTVAKDVDAVAAQFITVTGPVNAPLTGSGSSYEITVPEGTPAGQAYLVLTSSTDAPSDDNTVAGPAVIEIADNAYGRKADEPCKAAGGYKPHKPAHKPKYGKPSNPPTYHPAPPSYSS